MTIAFFEITDMEKEKFENAFQNESLIFFESTIQEVDIDKYKDADIISLFIHSKATKDILSNLKNLKLVTTRSTGTAHIDLDYCNENNISVKNVPLYGENTVAEHTFALILALSRKIHSSYIRSIKGNFSTEGLQGFDLQDKTIGIIGGTGVGKSTFVNLIPRLYDATEGEVKVGNINVKKYDIETLRNEVAMVLQKNVLFSGTIKENLKWGKEEATDEEIQRVCKLAQADEFIQSFPDKYDTYIEQGGTNVSGGQKQRLCIARALLKKPKILILDDSTSAVDTKTDKLIRKAFKEEIPNTTKIIIAQRIASVEDADKIIVFENGEINGFGTHEELLKTNAIYKEVYDSQVKGGEDNE